MRDFYIDCHVLYDSCGSPELQVLARFPCGIVPKSGRRRLGCDGRLA